MFGSHQHGPSKIAPQRTHHSLPYHFSHSNEPPALSLPLFNAVSTIRRPLITCVTLETTINKVGRALVKKCQFFNVFATDNFRMLCNDNGLTDCYHLAMVTLVSPLQYQWYCHCLMMPLAASPILLRSVRGLGPSMNV